MFTFKCSSEFWMQENSIQCSHSQWKYTGSCLYLTTVSEKQFFKKNYIPTNTHPWFWSQEKNYVVLTEEPWMLSCHMILISYPPPHTHGHSHTLFCMGLIRKTHSEIKQKFVITIHFRIKIFSFHKDFLKHVNVY